MRLRKSVAERDPNANLIDELVRAVHDQIKEDGSARTPTDSANERKRSLTERWKGSHIMAAVVEGGTASIYKEGVKHEVGSSEDTWTESVEFPNARGRIKAVSTGHGGWIELTNGMELCLNIRGENGVPLPNQEIGLELSLK